MALQLTQGAVQKIIIGGINLPKPVLQVIDIKQISANSGGQPRYRVILSDGVHHVTAMLATLLNPLVLSNEIKNHSVLRIVDYSVSMVQERKVMIPMSVEVLGDAPGRIGHPVSIAPKEGGEVRADAAPSAGMGAGVGMGAGPEAAMKPAVGAVPVHHAPVQSAPSVPVMTAMPTRTTGPTVRAPDMSASHVTPISALLPYGPKWTIKARVTSKTDIKTWNNARGSGKLFSINLLDEHSTEIRATFFQEGVDRYYDLIQLDHVYLFSGGKVKAANKQYSPTNEYELNFDEKATISEVQNDAKIAKNVYNFVPIANLGMVDANRMLDIIGVVTNAGAANAIISKSGKELVKRDVYLGDSSGSQVCLTLWNEKANIEMNVGDILALKSAKLSEYGGRSLGTSPGTGIEINPDLEAAHRLQGWWSTSGSSANLRSLTERGGPGGGGEGREGPLSTIELRKSIVELKDTATAGNDGPVHVVKATIINLRHDDLSKISYPACPGITAEGRTCNKKLVDQSNDGTSEWSCERCGRQVPHYRYILSGQITDHTGSEYVTFFDAEAQALLGVDANTIQKIATEYAGSTSIPEITNYFKNATHKEVLLTTKAKLEERGGEMKLKVTVVKAREMDYVRESKALIAAIKKYD